MVNTPIPHSLKSEAKKAAKILKEFTVPTAKMGPDKLIPGNISFKLNGIFHPNQLHQSISNLRIVGCYFSFLFKFE